MLIPLTQLLISYSLTFGWSANTETNLAGYKLYYGSATRSYATIVNAGNVTRVTVPGFENGETYYFALTAFNTAGLESDFSNEITYSKPITLSLDRLGILHASVAKGKTYEILKSNDLKTWDLLQTITPSTTDLTLGVGFAEARKFYKLRKVVTTRMEKSVVRIEGKTMPPPLPPGFPKPPKLSFLRKLKLALRYHPGHHFDERKGAERLMER